MATFSMASMTDVIFLLLVFFMVTSTFVFPTALEINLPQGVEQTPAKPSTRVYIDSMGNISAAYADAERVAMTEEQLAVFMHTTMEQDTTQTAVAIYADTSVPYGRIVDVLNIGAAEGIKMVLATKVADNRPTEAETPANAPENIPTL